MIGVEDSLLIQGERWNVLTAGEGAAIVFLHNGGGNLWNWAHQIQHFSSRYRVIAPDLPGFGRSHRPEAPLTLDRFVEGLKDLLGSLECDRPILVGNCIGASIALEYALRHPGKVRALALFNVCGGLPMLSRGLRIWAGLNPRTPLGKTLHRALIDCAAHPMMRRFHDPLLYASGAPDLHPALRECLDEERRDRRLRPSLHSLVTGLESFNVFTRPREKPGNFPPVLLGWGKQNRTLDAKWSGVIADWLAPEQLCLIEDAGHMANYERPGRVNDLLDSFFENSGNGERQSEPSLTRTSTTCDGETP
jgi:pimeloyl-ACP methyl ester carboxylesterase